MRNEHAGKGGGLIQFDKNHGGLTGLSTGKLHTLYFFHTLIYIYI